LEMVYGNVAVAPFSEVRAVVPPPASAGVTCFGSKPKKEDVPPGYTVSPFNSKYWDTPEAFYLDAMDTWESNTGSQRCIAVGARGKATPAELGGALAAGANWCVSGWVEQSSKIAEYPITTELTPGCAAKPGVKTYIPPDNKAGVVCFGVKPSAEANKLNAHKARPFNASQWSMFGESKLSSSGFLACDGAYVDKELYQNLYSILKSMYGPETATQFKLPDLRGVFLRGADNGRGLDPGRQPGSYQEDDFKSHTHSAYVASSNSNNVDGQGWSPQPWYLVNSYQTSDRGVGAYKNNLTQATGGEETRPKNVALMPYIKY
jgi:microcystin-dependent protein